MTTYYEGGKKENNIKVKAKRKGSTMGGFWQLVWIYSEALHAAALFFAFSSFQDLPFLCILFLRFFW